MKNTETIKRIADAAVQAALAQARKELTKNATEA
jgi:hypothetical protein